MSVTYQCDQCGRWSTVRRDRVGSKARCRDCGFEQVIPNAPDLFDEGVDGPLGGAGPRRSTPRISPSPTPATPPLRPRPSPSAETAGESASWWKVLSWIGFIVLIGLKVGGPMMRGRGRPPRNPQPMPPPVARPVDVDLRSPISIPPFPKLDPGREIEPGVFLHEIKLRPPQPNRRPVPPGYAGTLWLYLPGPAASIEPKSLPCVLIAPAGSNLLSGMKLADEDRPEHIPYVKAGFAVLAFDLDGDDPQRNRPFQGSTPSMNAFLRARAGLVNGRIAKSFLEKQVTQVDPNRLYVAGHSSAATFALIFAANESQIQGCAAYAPITDIQASFGPASEVIRRMGYGALVDRFSPVASASALNSPVFLFHARGDEVVEVEQTLEFAEKLKSLGKNPTVEIVPQGGHSKSMIEEGIPKGIAWLKSRDAQVVKDKAR